MTRPSTLPSNLEAALAPVFPPDAVWQRDQSGRLEQVTVTAKRSVGHRALTVTVRPDADYQVEFWYADGIRGPAEALFVVTPENEAGVVDAIAELVRGLLEERVVLAFTRGWSGGSKFLTVDELATIDRGRLTAVYSWRGTFDS
jgi:hypothetical protein